MSKLIIDKDTAEKAVCQMFGIEYVKPLCAEVTDSNEVIHKGGHEIKFDFEFDPKKAITKPIIMKSAAEFIRHLFYAIKRCEQTHRIEFYKFLQTADREVKEKYKEYYYEES